MTALMSLTEGGAGRCGGNANRAATDDDQVRFVNLFARHDRIIGQRKPSAVGSASTSHGK